MGWRLAKSLGVLRTQVNAACPKRSKSSDGTIGDAAHSSRASDHNPNKAGVVQALDLTHDPKNGFDSYAFAETLRMSKDKRIKNVISNGRIFSSTVSPWQWRKYTGANKHTVHVHISVVDEPAFYDNASPWDIGAAKAQGVIPPKVVEKAVEELAPLKTERPKKTGITKGAVTGGGLSVAAIAASIWESVQSAPESLLQALIGAAQKPSFWIIAGVTGVCIFIYFKRQGMKK